MPETKLTGMRVTAIERLRNSPNGNPTFAVSMVDNDGCNPSVYKTARDASAGYDVENIANEHKRMPTATVAVTIVRGRLSYIDRECSVCGDVVYRDHSYRAGYRHAHASLHGAMYGDGSN